MGFNSAFKWLRYAKNVWEGINSENIFDTTGTHRMVKLSENKKKNGKLCTVRKIAGR
jgi:hypothetical protein